MRFNLPISEVIQNGKIQRPRVKNQSSRIDRPRCFYSDYGIRTESMTINSEIVDVTDKDGNGGGANC